MVYNTTIRFLQSHDEKQKNINIHVSSRFQSTFIGMMYNTVVVCVVASIMCNSVVLCVGFVRLGWVCYEFGLGWVGVRVLWTKGVWGLGGGRVG